MKTAMKTLLLATAVTGATLAQADSRYDNGRHNGWDRGYGNSRGDTYYGHSDYDYARVVRTEPLTRRIRVVEPRRECTMETVYDRRDDYYRRADYSYGDRYYENGGRGSVSATNGAIVGGLIGGVIGNQVGRGDGRRIATVAGALIGAAIGHDAGKRRGDGYDDRYGDRRDDRYDNRYGREVERCRVRQVERYEERVDGYRVTYSYNGREYTTRMNYHPGEKVRVRVDVFPDEG